MAKSQTGSLAAQVAPPKAAEERQTGVGQLALPNTFGAPPVVPMETRFRSPYICFAHPKRKDEWDRIVAKFGSIEEGDVFFVSPEQLVRLNSAKMSLLCAKQCWTRNDGMGKVLEVSWKERPKPWTERVLAVVLLYLEDRIVPCNVSAKTTRCPAFVTLHNELIAAADPDWQKRSPAHEQASVVCPQPFARFYADVTLGSKRIGKDSGLPYRPFTATCKPTTNVEWVLIKQLIEDPETAKRLQDAADLYNARLAEWTRLVPKETAASS